jgi:predicted nuclease of restriction endonuclease-like (RecB) superfamily
MSRLPHNYISTLSHLKEQIRKARIKTALLVNAGLIKLYWEIGIAILEMQREQGWGAKVIDRLSADLKVDFPDFKGLSVRNLKYMARFAKTFPVFGQQPAAQMQNADTEVIGQQPVAQLPWGHIQVLMDKVQEPAALKFYILQCLENSWGRNELIEQINSNLFERQGHAITNFSSTLPAPESDLVQQTLKNPYLFDFLGLGDEARERDLENALVEHLKKFMLELGRGFAYVGRQKNLVVEGDDFFLDLLFYNFNLHCFIILTYIVL